MKKVAWIAGIVSVLALSGSFAAGADVPGRIELKVYRNKPVAFDHKGHAGRIGDCRKCHHKSDPGSEEKCSECHQPKRDGDTPSFREAMHLKCRGCHAKAGKKVKGSCKECHPGMNPKS